MPLCDRCDEEIPITAGDGSDLSAEQGISKQMLEKLQSPSDGPFTIIEGVFAVWTDEFEIEQQNSFPLLLCRDCTSEFVDWVDNPDITPSDEDESVDVSLRWAYRNR